MSNLFFSSKSNTLNFSIFTFFFENFQHFFVVSTEFSSRSMAYNSRQCNFIAASEDSPEPQPMSRNDKFSKIFLLVSFFIDLIE